MKMSVQYIDSVLQEMKVKSANQRKIIFDTEVNDNEVIKTIYYLDKIIEMDKVNGRKEPITILFHSGGGSIYSGNLLLGKLKEMQEKQGYTIIGIGGGICASMAFQFLQACKVRKCYSYSRLMFHQPSSFSYSDLEDMERDIEEVNYLWEMMKKLVIKSSKITNEMCEEWKRIRKDKFFSTKELIDLEIVDEIIDL